MNLFVRNFSKYFLQQPLSYKKLLPRFNSYAINLKIGDLDLNSYVNRIKSEYQKLSAETTQSQRLQELQPIINILNERDKVISNIGNLNEFLNEKDEEIKKLAEEEKKEFETKILSLDETLKEVLLPKTEEDDIHSIVLDVNAGVGGQEAMLFANEIFKMYTNYTNYKGWNYELAEYLSTDIGGLRHASILIEGHNCFRFFKHEAGVHRVQRIPATEKSGRLHTSTISVTALPQPTDIQVNLQSKDLKIETKRATGAGGQHVNTTDSAVRIVHLPTNLAVECQTDRSQIKNREIALQRLRAKLYEVQLEEQLSKSEGIKKSQVKSSSRNEKIRTYNFAQDRITDHRLNFNVHNLKVFMLGGEPLDELIGQLDFQSKVERLREIVEKFSVES